MSSTLWLLKIRNRANPKLSLIAVLNSCEKFSQDSVRLSWYITIFDIALARNSVNLSYHLRGLTMSSTSSLTKLIKHHTTIKTTEISEATLLDTTINKGERFNSESIPCGWDIVKILKFQGSKLFSSTSLPQWSTDTFHKAFLLFLSHRLSISILNLNLVKNHLVFYTKLIIHTMNESVISVMERK